MNLLIYSFLFLFQALKAMKMSKFMPFIVFVAAPPVEILRNMHEFARQQGKTDKVRSVSFIMDLLYRRMGSLDLSRNLNVFHISIIFSA